MPALSVRAVKIEAGFIWNIISLRMKTTKISIYIKIQATCFLGVIVPVYWITRGPENFLWFCDIALFTVTLALWLENKFLASMMAVSVLLPEVVWNVDFFYRLLSGSHLFDLGATSYMFDPKMPWIVQVLSFLLHIYLPVILIWMLYKLGYHRKALVVQTALAWVVLPLSYWLPDRSKNINLVYGFGAEPQQWVSAPVYVVILMFLVPSVIYLPSHLLLKKLFGKD